MVDFMSAPAAFSHVAARSLRSRLPVDAVELLNVTDNTGISLTSSYAMQPGASVCGWYYSHPQSMYFGMGKLGQDQVHSYAERKGVAVGEMERWLAPNLGYDPQIETAQ